MATYHVLKDWMEVWALFIPIIFLCFRKKQPHTLKPVIAYVFIALYLNYLIDVVFQFQDICNFPIWFRTNTYIYHINSIVRFFIFAYFFIKLDQPFLYWIKRIIPVLYLGFVIINFNFHEKFINYWFEDGYVKSDMSNLLLSVEAALLLIYCLQYYIYRMLEDRTETQKPPDFWIVTGLSVYVAISFPIYLYYDRLKVDYIYFAINIWKVHNVSFIIFCIFMAKAFNTRPMPSKK